MNYGYARVSTAKQGHDGNSLEDQREKLTAAGAEEIVEDIYTGTKMQRPGCDRLLDKLAAGDTLTVCKLDRFARTAADGAAVIQDLMARGVTVNILNMGRADNTPMGKLMITVMLAFAEFERDMIVERTQAGKAVARASGQRVDGRPPKYTPAQRAHAMGLLDAGNSYTAVEAMTGISKSTLIRTKRKAEKCQM